MSESDAGLFFGLGVLLGVAISAVVSFVVDLLNTGE